MGEKGSVCVTGAGGFLASWLVKLLLSKGYKVHGTVREPDDEKNAHLKKLERAEENLHSSRPTCWTMALLSAAITGCSGVFHVASPGLLLLAINEALTYNYTYAQRIFCGGFLGPASHITILQVDLIEPAVTGTVNVLKACSEAGVKRVVVVSSGAAILMNPNWPKDKVMDEDCWSDEQYCKTTENWYCASKTIAERAALQYLDKNNLDVITVCPTLILGPLLQSTANASSLFLVKLLKGGLETMENKTRVIVDVRDVAEALLLTYEKPEASGRYICAPHIIQIRNLVGKLRSMYPNYKYPKNFTDSAGDVKISSEKLKRLGWQCRPLEETLVNTVECFQKAGLLNND
ncbi:cinnamoyl-CoA reductase 2 [Cinnamomum micranthum f. kanehirae]|uniref:Cinnamoyl-CoA reductase 2 n=1 Tax=Cinnamomum micranthum f. kanehirae TaxID=337451 RepID=A0A3S3M3T6_9MAGN|nr:cinnamoyl-CoA reductase 2 [Cinnamomum micranthum f. kanehirae]